MKVTFVAIPLALLAVLIWACSNDGEQQQLQQSIGAGALIYQERCQNCHGANGEGLAQLMPPLAGSDYLKDTARVICAVRQGLAGPLTVNGKPYNQAMPAHADLYDAELAQVLTYVYNSWGNTGGLIRQGQVGKKCHNQ